MLMPPHWQRQSGLRFAFCPCMLKNFRAYQLSKDLYWCCKELKLPSFLKDQLLRASSSVALTLAEGSGKRTFADQRKFYAMAYGSLRECQAILELEKIKDESIADILDQLGAILFTLSRQTADRTVPTAAAASASSAAADT